MSSSSRYSRCSPNPNPGAVSGGGGGEGGESLNGRGKKSGKEKSRTKIGAQERK